MVYVVKGLWKLEVDIVKLIYNISYKLIGQGFFHTFVQVFFFA